MTRAERVAGCQRTATILALKVNFWIELPPTQP